MNTCPSTYSFAPFLEAQGSDFFADDPDLSRILRHHGVTTDGPLARLSAYGRFAASSASDGADAADRPDSLPRLSPYNAWGEPNPVQLEIHPATRRVLAAALRAGTATNPDVYLRYGLAYLGAQVGEAGVTCPLACTDGLVRSLQELPCGDEAKAALDHILTQAPGGPVHGAQFVTEVQGGSDAGTNELVARREPDGSYRLYGKKWFCSNPWAQYWAVTARPEGAPAGARGVSLFLVSRSIHHKANGFRLDRLKDKLGTRSLPTAEMTFDGALAWPVGDLDAGLSNMVRIVLTTSRFWNALAAASFVRAAERIAHAYASFRQAFGRPIIEFPLVAETLAVLTRDRRRLTAAAFAVLAVWEQVAGVERQGQVPDVTRVGRARILVMLAKTCATRRATRRVHDAIMVLAGNGIEERFSALPRLWRDSIIMETWEGPHGLLVERCWLELQRSGAKDDPIAATEALLGPGADAGVVEVVGRQLRDAFAGADERTRLVRFDAWCESFYDALGDQAWAHSSLGLGS